ncbi:MAG: YggS family pyridoxal phosphate-dependent enzyme [Acidobacteria bacterium]|nr:YggS family pyridoxal phosphate-dependent enzyme [Acidobacteriota bacterium]
MLEETGIKNRFDIITRKIGSACERVGRPVSEVVLVGVSKTFPAEVVTAGITAGLRVLGENRVQEAAAKIETLGPISAAYGVSWHLIGHLQTNKVRRAVELFSLIHSVDSFKLAEKIDTNCGETGRRMPILVEINLGGETSKSGVSQQEAPLICEQIALLSNLDLCGLMTVPPASREAEESRPYFVQLRKLRDQLCKLGLVGPSFTHLSMGMSNDFEVAIEEGATLVRVGTALFGSR